jgi:anaerobic ribonucleoside-triphosphate reductase
MGVFPFYFFGVEMVCPRCGMLMDEFVDEFICCNCGYRQVKGLSKGEKHGKFE